MTYRTQDFRRGAAVQTRLGQERRNNVLALLAAIIPAAAILVACASMLAALY